MKAILKLAHIINVYNMFNKTISNLVYMKLFVVNIFDNFSHTFLTENVVTQSSNDNFKIFVIFK